MRGGCGSEQRGHVVSQQDTFRESGGGREGGREGCVGVVSVCCKGVCDSQ